MKFQEIKPHSHLAPFIDAYWEITCSEEAPSVLKVMPDGCIDIMINLGAEFRAEYANLTLRNGKGYLGGAIKYFQEAITSQETHLAGIRFKPAAFSHFYNFSSLHETTDHILELAADLIPEPGSVLKNARAAFDAFFHKKLRLPGRSLLPVIQTVRECRGNISVCKLAEQHCTTVKQLQRSFQYHVGLSPKEFTNIVRYRSAQQLIQARHPVKKLSEIAFECGYADQAHLSREIRKYTGLTPTAL
ncbi:hypothetical protein C7T94_11785 [Pedobacter yulinensis]|uniref:HTH araC/xylS-type domain-containing protein n=1 Tax=Pedobacter yulinensis TaxID=2126353 RepID=A0A2T3HLF8_9SPHI|nr:helix-turn-helix transcriptional regulator [Pedobacter yulinensis]PST83264.1 hypothetical protein C7T94_11785 [Pedobacter yulinensis]